MDDKNNIKVPDGDKNKKVDNKQRRFSNMVDNRIAKSLKPYMEINKVASQISKPYTEMNKVASQISKPYMEMNKVVSQIPKPYIEMKKVASQISKPYTEMSKVASQISKPYTEMNKVAFQIPKPYFVTNNMVSTVKAYSVLENAKTNRLSSLPTANTVWQEYLKRSENTANIFRNAIKPFKANNAFTKNYSQIAEVSDRFQKLVERTLGKHSENIKVATLLMKNGWVTSEFFFNSVLKDNYDKSETEILKYIERFYTENNYQRFFRVFDLVIVGFEEQGLNEGYRLSLVKIRKLLKQDFDNYDLFMNITFSIIDYLCSFKFGILSTNDYIREKSIGTARRKYADKNGQLTKIDVMSMFGVLKSWWKKINFKKGLDRTDFGRSPIEHGRYDPRRYKRTDFIKLVLFMFNVLMAPDPDFEK